MNNKSKIGITAGVLVALSLARCQGIYDEARSLSKPELSVHASSSLKNKPMHNYRHEIIEGDVMDVEDISFLVDSHKIHFQNMHVKSSDGIIHKIINKDTWLYKKGDWINCEYIPCTTASYRDIASGFDEDYGHRVEVGNVSTDGIWYNLIMGYKDSTQNK